MKVLVLGAAGMIGSKTVSQIISGGIGHPVTELILHDMIEPLAPEAPFGIRCCSGDVTNGEEIKRLAEMRADVIIHLAAVVSGEAEKDFEKGWHVNASSMWLLLDALKLEHEKSGGMYRPRLVFASSIAVFGGPYPEIIDDSFLCAPQTSYGSQKVLCELLVNDYSRKGFIDGISIRLPTICVRPGSANLAASSFFSSIIREPLNGKPAILPVSEDIRHWFASPRSAATFLIHAAQLDSVRLDGRRSLNMPGLSCTVGEQIETLRRVAGSQVLQLIERKPDPAIAKIVEGWPQNFEPTRAMALGFKAEKDFEEIIRVYLDEDFQP